jgi:hypothetical protein
VARKRWREVGQRIQDALGPLSNCVRGDRFRCRAEAQALYAVMGDLAAAEGAIEASCPRR